MTLDSMIDAARASRARLDDERRAAILDRVLDARGAAVATPLVSEPDRRTGSRRWIAVGAAALALAAAITFLIVGLGDAGDPAPRPPRQDQPGQPAGVAPARDDDPPIIPRRSPSTPLTINPQSLSSHQLTGGKEIFPDDETKQLMADRGVEVVAAAINLCVDTDGRVSKVELRGFGSGFADYDRKILEGVRAWTYKPFIADGVAIAVCSSVTFVYRQRS